MDKCIVCGGDFKPSGCTTGYGKDSHGHKICFQCCGALDRRELLRKGKAIMYLDSSTWKLSNWPGTFSVHILGHKKGRHNLAKTRYDVWFKLENRLFHGVQYGEFTQLCHIAEIRA